MKILSKLLSRIQAAFGADMLVSGTVVDKHYYPAGQPTSDVAELGSGKNGRILEEAGTIDASDSWVLVVDGIDKRGNEVKGEEIEVGPMTFNSKEKGDPYP